MLPSYEYSFFMCYTLRNLYIVMDIMLLTLALTYKRAFSVKDWSTSWTTAAAQPHEVWYP